MAFTLENAVVEFKADGLDKVLAASKQAAESVSSIVSAAQQTALSIGETATSMRKLGTDAAKTATGLERNATAFAVIHGVATDLSSVLPLVSAELDRAANQMTSFGSNRSDIAAIAAEMGKIRTQAEGVSKSLGKTGGGFGGMIASAVSGFGAMLTGNSLSKQTSDLAAAAPAASAAIRPLAIDMGALRSNSTGAAKAMMPLVGVMNSIAQSTKASAAGLQGMTKSLSFSASARGTQAFQTAIGQIQPKAMLANQGLSTLTPTVGTYTQQTSMATLATRDFARSLTEVKTGATGQGKQLAQLQDAMNRMGKQPGDMKKGRGFGISMPSMPSMPSFGGMTTSLLGLAGIGSIGALGGGILKLGMDAETTQISFETLLGSASRAKTMIAELRTLAAETPLSDEGVIGNAKNMLAFGFAAESVIPMLTTVGDAATSLAGGGAAGEEAIAGITRALGQMKGKGKVQAEEMMQLAERGIPAWDMLASAMGVSVAEAQKQVTAGSVSAQVGIDALLKGMEQRFGGGMKRMSTTSIGMLSNIGADIKNIGTAVYQPFDPLVRSALKAGLQITAGLKSAIKPSIELLSKALGSGIKFEGIGEMMHDFGDRLTSFTQMVIDAFSTAKQWVSSLSPEVLGLAGTFATALPVIGALSTGFRVFAPMVSPVLSLFAALGPAVGFLISPIGLVAAGVTGLAVALSQNAAVASSFGRATSAAWDLVTSGWQMATEVAGELSSTAKGLYAELMRSDAWKAVTSGVSSVIDWIGNLMSDAAVLTRNWRETWVIVAESVRLAGANIGNVLGNLWGNISSFTTTTFDFVTSNWRNMGVVAVESVILMGTNIGTALSNIGSNLGAFFSAMKGWVSGKGFDWQWTGLTDGFQNSTATMDAALNTMTQHQFQWTGLTEGWQSTNEKIEAAKAQMEENEAKRLQRMIDAEKKAAGDIADAAIESEQEKDNARKSGAAANSATQDKIKKDMESTSISWVDVADRIKAGFEDKSAQKPSAQPESAGRATGVSADNAMIEAAKATAMQSAEAVSTGITEHGFSDGNEGARRRAAMEESAREATLNVTQEPQSDEKANALLQQITALQESYTQMMDKLLQAATSTGLKIEPQVAVVG